MTEITRAVIARVGVDLAKNVIQVHGVDAAGKRVVSRAIKRDQFLAWCVQHLLAVGAGLNLSSFSRSERVFSS